MADSMQGLLMAIEPLSILVIIAGVFVGIVVGLIPGIGAGVGLSLLLPVIFNAPPLIGLFLLLSLWAADGYGASISSILLNVPGGSGAVATCFDGHPMARQGKGGEAIGIAMGASMVAGIIGTIVLMLVAPPIARFAVIIGPAEYALLALVGMTMIGGFSSDAQIKGLISGMIGLMTSFFGYDLITGRVRFNFGTRYLFDGVDLILAVLGLFAIASLVYEGMEGGSIAQVGKISGSVFRGFIQSLKKPFSILRGTIVGVGMGAMPGIGITLASLVAYNVEKKFSRHPEEFGNGAMEGIIGPEAANNSCQPAALIPTLTLGIPAGSTSAIFLAALTMYGISPGISLFTDKSPLVWALMWGIIVASLAYVLVGLIFANALAKLTVLPVEYLVPVTLAICFIGAFGTTYSYYDLVTMFIYGVLGYFMMVLKYPLAPAVLGVVIGPILEKNFFRALLISDGSYNIFFGSTVCVALWILLFLVLFGRYIVKFAKRAINSSSQA